MTNDSTALREALAHAAHFLPAQAPIRRFVHHNTLHGFEHLPFDRAVIEAGQLFGAEPYLLEEQFHTLQAAGRIERRDIEAVLAEDGVDDRPVFEGGPGRRTLRTSRLVHPAPIARGEAVRWLASESDLLRRPHPGAPEPARGADVHEALRALFTGAESIAATMRPRVVADASPRLRDLFVSAELEDPDELVNPFLSRVMAAYLDQGVAYWPMPDRERGLYVAFRELYSQPAGPPSPWRARLRRELERHEAGGFDAEAAALDELRRLGVPVETWKELLRRTLLALPGWGGMAHQLEQRPDSAPVEAPPIALMDVVAIRLLLDRLAAERLGASNLGTVGLAATRVELLARSNDAAVHRDLGEVALELFVLAQLAGVSAERLPRVAPVLAQEIEDFDHLARRRAYQLAYERRFFVSVVDAISGHIADGLPDPVASPKAQLVFCIDDREESMRRHLEELEPEIATYAFAGFFNVAMFHHAFGEARPRPLCPVVITPRHAVREQPVDEASAAAHRARRRLVGRLSHEVAVGSRTLLRGGLVSLLAQFQAIPMVTRTLFPRTADRVGGRGRGESKVETTLGIERRAQESSGDLLEGFTIAEMASNVGAVLRAIGLTDRFAPIVAMVGHGSTSVNNPHQAAYDCGACAGAKGGPNARAFAAMANHPEVRHELAYSGIAIPESTWFLGAYHDTGSDEVFFYDEAGIPSSHAARYAELRALFDTARALDAHERCRRFEHIDLDVDPKEALAHVEARTADLGQPRPECGHATNALLVVGRRELTRGLFLDRRAFLNSYDPTKDADGGILRGILAAAIPVCAGINLEYWFSYVDPRRYGCGTKLPQNVAGLLGVMDGHSSDLRTGLPWQMVEIHEPLRLVCIVESSVDRLAAVLDALPAARRLVTNHWVHLVALDPKDRVLYRFGATGFEPCRSSKVRLPTAARSVDWYSGHRDHLPFARIGAALRTNSSKEAIQ